MRVKVKRVRYTLRTCLRCGGSGTLGSKNETCYYCQGSGVIDT